MCVGIKAKQKVFFLSGIKDDTDDINFQHMVERVSNSIPQIPIPEENIGIDRLGPRQSAKV